MYLVASLSTMIKWLLFVMVILQCAYTTAPKKVYSTENGQIIFRSDAPLELITASSKKLRGKFDVDKKIFAFSVAISSFDGFNNALQKEHFNENYLESDQFPQASFSGKIIEDLDYTVDGNYTVRAKGNLTIHGVVQERIIKTNLQIKQGTIALESKFTVLLAEHNIPIPKVIHEKLASEIKVEVNADLTAP